MPEMYLIAGLLAYFRSACCTHDNKLLQDGGKVRFEVGFDRNYLLSCTTSQALAA